MRLMKVWDDGVFEACLVNKFEGVRHCLLSEISFDALPPLNFIYIYWDIPMLWQVPKEYMDKNERSAALKKITNSLKMCR